MLPSGTIEVDRVWKRFRSDRRRTLLREELERAWGRLHGHQHGWRWALRDITFSLEPGESVGVVGVNGSGKTTLLRLLAEVMYPYAGRVEVSGKIGALINLTAGLHPDLTGAENVYITGALHGMRRREVARRFDEIVAFAELEDAIGRQVKFYSSGMQLRLGFAIAALMEPDVLLVDEVLGVGDDAFRQKCLTRTRDVIAAGATLVYVSHDLASIEGMCRRGIWLRDGTIHADGLVREAVGAYRRSVEEQEEHAAGQGLRFGAARLAKAEVSGPEGDGCRTDEALEVRVIVESSERRAGTMYIGVSEGTHTPIFVLRQELSLSAGETEARCWISHLPLPRGRFFAWVAILDEDGRELLHWQPATEFDVKGPDLDPAPQGIVRLAPVQVEATWQVAPR
jgi:ABC-type polysaccharide/polyol phosphate transport system ATPase subunit